MRLIDIVGLESESNGRSCPDHEICGYIVKEGDILHLQETSVRIGDSTEYAIKASLLNSDSGCCVVGFIPKRLLKASYIKRVKFVQVLKLYSDSDNRQDRRRSKQNCGMALCKIMTLQ